MSSESKTTISSKTSTSAAQAVGSQALQKEAVGVIQNMEVLGPDKEHQAGLTQHKENKTGMPYQLKLGVESLSGMSMDHVKVHYNSSQPAQLNALAYAQGSDIHIGPGQEKHLPHEAWHVVQQAQGRVQATRQMKSGVPVNDDPGLEHEADVMGAKAMQLKSGLLSYNSPKAKSASLPSSVFQMVARKAVVTWGVTHLVKAQDDSLFGKEGKDGWKAGELPVEEGELRQGQPIVVDDELVFMSRRGSNQENAEKRERDSTQELKQQWNLVYAVDKTDYTGKDVYIRFETIRFTDEAPKKERKKIGKVEIPEKDVLGEAITGQLSVIKGAWEEAALKRRRSIGQVKYKDKKEVDDEQEIHELDDQQEDTLPEGLTSGWNWDQYDEGEDVAEEMSKPLYRAYELKNKPTNFMFKAYYEDEGLDVPITFLMMEATAKEDRLFRDDFKYNPSEPQFFYIRWLVGHPVKKGGGSELMGLAKQKAFESQYAIYVQVAYSAIKFYTDSGFQVVENGEFRKGVGYGDTLLKYVPPEL